MITRMITIILFCLYASISWAAPFNKDIIALSEANNRFAFNLYKNLNTDSNNICFSPYCISSAFAMTYLGAKGETKNEIAKVLSFTNDPMEVARNFSLMDRFLTILPSNVNDRFFMTLGNSVWVQEGFRLLPKFLTAVNTYYPGQLHQVDFIKQPETSVRAINSWVKEHTFGRITDLLSDGDVNKSTTMVLVSSIYLKAQWAKPFDPQLTQESTFFASGDNLVNVQMMNESDRYAFFQNDKLAMIKLPYITTPVGLPELEMFILLPKKREGIADLEKALTLEQFNTWEASLETHRVELYLPKFKIEETIELKKALANLGMIQSFSELADFSDITNYARLEIDKVIHKAFMDVNENGTEAAAATAIIMKMTEMLEPQKPLIFRADHPFVYILRERNTGAILFMGRVNNPQSK